MDARPATRSTPDRVTFLPCRPNVREHERVSQCRVAERIAALLGCPFAVSEGIGRAQAPLGYVVPNDTLIAQQAHALGIRADTDLFGGIVPFPFVATKTITHPLVDARAAAPTGWNAELGERLRDVTLPGFSTYARADALEAGRRLLVDGEVRIKLASGIGGAGQWVVVDEPALDARLGELPAEAFERDGVVLERQLATVRTFSVGRLHVGPWQVAYFGTQRTTRSRHDHEVYGGSSLTVVRGGFEELVDMASDPAVRLAVDQARIFHETVLAAFGGIAVSRCNYDVVEGADAKARPLSGVLEQSWRIGGASGAEVAALEAFKADATRRVVRASTTELHAADVEIPPGATIYFAGVDEHLGPIVKYAEVDPA